MATKVWLGTTDSNPATAGNWSPSGQPTSGDNVIITGSNAIDGGTLSASGNLASFITRDFASTIGSEDADLVVDLAASSLVSIDTTGKSYLDFNASDVDVNVHGTQVAGGTIMGLHLKGAGTNSLNVYNSANVLLLETLDADINTFSASATVITAVGADAVNFTGPGKLIARGGLTNIYANGSTVDYYGSTACTTIQAESGATINFWASQDVTNVNAYGGTIDLKDSTAARVSTNNDVRAGGTIIFGRNWTPTNTPGSATSYQISAAA